MRLKDDSHMKCVYAGPEQMGSREIPNDAVTWNTYPNNFKQDPEGTIAGVQRFCTQCGTAAVSAGARFCRACGAELPAGKQPDHMMKPVYAAPSRMLRPGKDVEINDVYAGPEQM